MSRDTRSPGSKLKIIGQGHGLGFGLVLAAPSAARLRGEARGVARSAAASEPSACGRVNVVSLTSVLDRKQFFPVRNCDDCSICSLRHRRLW